jgi:hypothetical protein
MHSAIANNTTDEFGRWSVRRRMNDGVGEFTQFEDEYCYELSELKV